MFSVFFSSGNKNLIIQPHPQDFSLKGKVLGTRLLIIPFMLEPVWAKLGKYRFLLAGFYCTMNVKMNKGSIYNRRAMNPFSHCHL